MTKFYTNVALSKNDILLRGYENGKRIQRQIPYKPYLFVPTPKESKYATLEGRGVGRVDFDSIREARDFLNQYKDVDGMPIYGLNNFIYTFIYDNYAGEIQYDPQDVSVVSIDIEVDIANDKGFPDIQLADNEITLITMSRNGKMVTLGCKPYESKDPNVQYYHCKDETHLLQCFIELWNSPSFSPDIVTGWNCVNVNSYISCKEGLLQLKDIGSSTPLLGRELVAVAPVTLKEEYITELKNGHRISTSADHRLSVKYRKKGYSVKFENGLYTVDEISKMLNDHDVFLPQYLHTGGEGINISDEELYLAGLLYTDGTLWQNNSTVTIYNTDQSIIDQVTKFTSGSTPSYTKNNFKPCYRMYWQPRKEILDLVYHNREKQLNVTKLSQLTKNQFAKFLSGIIDGDGSVIQGVPSFCDYNNSRDAWQALFSWFGVTTTITQNTYRITSELLLDCAAVHKLGPYTWQDYTREKTPSKKLKQFFNDNELWVGIDSIINTHNVVEMQDIETSDNHFIMQGCRVHNCEFFDIPYIINRIMRVLGKSQARKLSPWGFLSENKLEIMGREQQTWNIVGINILDYMQLYKKFAYTIQESYSLDHIAFQELGERKLDYGEYGSLAGLQVGNWERYVDYNIRDTLLVDRLDDKLKLIELVFAMAYDAKVNYQDTFTTVRAWDIIIHNYLLERGTVVHQISVPERDRGILGGYVKDPQVGMHKWVVSLDLNSLYPSIIQQYNISAETHVDTQGIRKLINEERIRRAK